MRSEQLLQRWQITTLGAIARKDGYGLVDGPFGSNLPASDYVPFGIPVVRGSNLTLGDARFVDDEFVFVSEDTAHRLERSLCKPEDIIITKKGTLGQIGFIPPNHRYRKFLISSNQMKLSVDRGLADPLFVYYHLASSVSREKIIQDSEATGVPKTNLAYLRTFPIILPPLPEQRAIAHILGTLDDKIELNRRMNETLEAMARALFKSWFVDFDPVRAKAQGRQPAGMDAETAALFPDSFEDLELGEVPKGWKVSTVGDVFDLTMGQSPPGETYNESGEGMPFFQGRADFGFRYPSNRVYCTAPTRFANPGDTLVSVRAPVGDINMAAEACAIGRGVAAVRHKTGSRSYTYYAMHTLKDEFTRFEAEGTVFGSINKDSFRSLAIISPPAELVLRFEQQAFPVDQLLENNEKESLTLATLRDVLLPKLMSGEVRVKDAEAFIGHAL